MACLERCATRYKLYHEAFNLLRHPPDAAAKFSLITQGGATAMAVTEGHQRS
jgi:hypothetical protein